MFKNFAGNIFYGIHANAHASVCMCVVRRVHGNALSFHADGHQILWWNNPPIEGTSLLRQHLFIPSHCLVSAQVCLLLPSYLQSCLEQNHKSGFESIFLVRVFSEESFCLLMGCVLSKVQFVGHLQACKGIIFAYMWLFFSLKQCWTGQVLLVKVHPPLLRIISQRDRDTGVASCQNQRPAEELSR